MTDTSKPALRQHFRTVRRAFVDTLAPAQREALERALAAIAAPLLAGFSRPASYCAVADEISPRFIEVATALPRVGRDGLSFHQCPPAALVPGFAGILQPPADAPRLTPDVLLVPLLAITPAGVRLGQGKGYYDRALALAPARTIALAWDVQVTDSLPNDLWDIPIDFLATPTRLFACAQSR
jgi:5-formyltetrahydrofolate cyclo-ligase